ncbi:MAG: hypothetical protein DHS20C14_09610 [Phycisphaeraceae bacterium]|nr:MAG: hypothetical protein DHS20C14_09610 [Phycisphaeraceae bacterium]
MTTDYAAIYDHQITTNPSCALGDRSRTFTAILACLVALVTTAWITPRAAAEPVRTLDVYGTDELDVATLRAEFGADLDRLASLYFEDDREPFGELREDLTERIGAGHDFAFIKLSVVPGWGAADTVPLWTTVDVVEAEDAARRMPFRDEPTGTPADPGGLIERWTEYERTGNGLMRSGNLGSIRCDALHCLHGFAHPDLAPFGEEFDRGVPAHRDELLGVLRSDAEPGHRAAAAFLLAHTRDAEFTAVALTDAIFDPSYVVRNAAMRVLGQMGRTPEYAALIPIEPILVAVDFPTVYDRNKALTTLRWLVATPEGKHATVTRAGDQLMAMLRLETGPNRGPAHQVLCRLSGEEFGERDHAAWQGWLDGYAASLDRADADARAESP